MVYNNKNDSSMNKLNTQAQETSKMGSSPEFA